MFVDAVVATCALPLAAQDLDIRQYQQSEHGTVVLARQIGIVGTRDSVKRLIDWHTTATRWGTAHLWDWFAVSASSPPVSSIPPACLVHERCLQGMGQLALMM